jgi:Leucine-rich repeat (LRR) protein
LTGYGVFAQELSDDEKQAKYEQEVAETERWKRIYARDPQRFQDSVQAIRIRKLEAEAVERLARYQSAPVDSLETIDLSYCRLVEIPDFVFGATTLKVLILDHNSIRKLPKELNGLDSLKRIYWRSNDLGVLKPKMAKMPRLEKLVLDQNGLSKLPNLKRFPALRILELKQNMFADIQVNKLKKNSALRELTLAENPLELGKQKYEKLTNLRILKLTKCGLTDLHPAIYTIPNLDDLQLQENLLTSLPEGISRLSNLTKFSVYKNKLQSLPTDFYEMANLKVADMYYNELEVLPARIGQLQNLEIFYFSHNRIYDVPAEIGELTKLRELYLHHNRISVLPSSLGNLRQLRVVRVSDNNLTDFPTSLLHLKELEYIDVNNNALTTLPEEIEQLEKLELFTFLDNDVQLNAPENAHVPYMIERMIKRGVQCLPRIYREEEVQETGE